MDWRIESAMPGMAWPAIPAPAGAAVLALMYQLEQSQWLSPERLRELQLRQLDNVVRHAATYVPYYRERTSGGRFDELPVLTRRDLMERYEALKSERLPPEHGAVAEIRTSGSTGAPVRVLKTQLSQLVWNAITLRDHAWHRRDLGGKLAAIRHGVSEQKTPSWGVATAGVVATGPAASLGLSVDAATQLEWLQREQPQYLLTYPSIVAELARLSLLRGTHLPGLREVRTLGEMLPPHIRAQCREAWDVPVVDMYSANEVGYIALQCPESETYHVQSESVLVEVLDERGRPCGPGETGRVVVSDLHNFATPLLRYEIGDYAEVTAPCACGRGLPTLSRIAGRVRNMLLSTDGKRYWPTFGQQEFLDIAPILQHQFVQRTRDRLEARLVLREPLSYRQELRLRERIASRLPAGIQINFVRVESLPRGRGGKFEDFVSEVREG